MIDLSRHSVLAISLRLYIFFCMIWLVNKADTMCYISYCVDVGYFCRWNLFKQTHYVSCFADIHFYWYTIITVEKKDTMC